MLIYVRDHSDMVGTRQTKLFLCYNLHGSMVLALSLAHLLGAIYYSEWRNCIKAQRKVDLRAPGAPKGPKVGMFAR